jgi:hypothetical protein
MIRTTLQLAVHPLHRAFLAGLLMGGAVFALLQAHPGSAFSLAMAVVLMAAGSASVVCLGLARTPRPVAVQAARRWLGAIGAGALLALHGLDWLGLGASL